ncbi:glycosyl hydrolase family 18 protein [Streptomyces sp. NPDC047737]|uniref:glycosyl hydrolase family 18 protein n=1 Tax=unclassified Streptomyces TaxID=2593676 RepID=UPI0033EB5312
MITSRAVTRLSRVLTATAVLAAAALATVSGAASTPRHDPLSTSTTASGPAPAPRTVSGWLPYWDQENAYRNALRHAEQLHTVSPFWYQAVAAGRIDAHPGAGERRIIDGLHGAGVKVVPTVMETMEPGALAAILTSPSRRTEHADALMRTVASRAYDGLDLDYESIATTGDSTYAAVRDGFTALATDLCRRLHTLGKQCVVTVFPKTATTGRIWDYAALGRVADRIRIMGYNLHSATGNPGPLAGTRWYDDILTRATAVVPADKLEMGLPAYGWDWPDRSVDKTRAKHVTWKEAEALRVEQGAPYGFDEVSGTPHFTYADGTKTREVWYQDARGVATHLPVLRKHGVTRTVLWALGFEDPRIWPVLADR